MTATERDRQDPIDLSVMTKPVAAAVGVADLVRLGWLMSQMYHDIPQRWVEQHNGLPTVSELGRDERMALSFTVLDELLTPLGDVSLRCTAARAAWGAPLSRPSTSPVAAAAARAAEAPELARRTAALRCELDVLNSGVLTVLSVTGVVELTAYMTGRQLADTCRVPDRDLAELTEQLDNFRIYEVQANLAVLATRLPNRSAEAVSRSLDHWRAWATADNVQTWTVDDIGMVLGRQGRVWHSLLSGATDPQTLLTVDAWLAAADSSALTASRASRHLARRFWLPLVTVVSLVVFLVALSLAKAPGEAKVWTSLVSIAAGLGFTHASLHATVKKGLGAVQGQVSAAVELEALGWAATIAPTAPPTASTAQRGLLHHRPTAATSAPSTMKTAGPTVRPVVTGNGAAHTTAPMAHDIPAPAADGTIGSAAG